MANFSVDVVQLTQDCISDHPGADRLSIIKIGGYICISAKLEDGSHRYKAGDHVVYVPEGAVVPEELLKEGFWDEAKGKGILAGTKGNRVKALKLRGVFSQGILFPTEFDGSTSTLSCYGIPLGVKGSFAEDLDIVKYEAPIPTAMSGEVFSAFDRAVKYDFESIQKVTDMFDDDDIVNVSEKLHGTFVAISLHIDATHPEAFGDAQNVFITSKGLGAKGLFFKNNEANKNNLYVKTFRSWFNEDKLAIIRENLEMARRVAAFKDCTSIHVFGEIFGKGVQDLHYGFDAPTLRIFDIRIGDNNWLLPFEVTDICEALDFQTVPQLYDGAFDLKYIEELRDGKDSIAGKNVREGVVIKAAGRHPLHGRKIAKWVSPDYLLRKGETTEFA